MSARRWCGISVRRRVCAAGLGMAVVLGLCLPLRADPVGLVTVYAPSTGLPVNGDITSISSLYSSSSSQLNGTFDITVNFVGSGLTASQQAIFSQVEALWESLLSGYQPGITITGVTIDASAVAIDGVGGILGQAGPTTGVNQAGFTLATTGTMQFDTADLAAMETGGTLDDVIAHEMAHVLGFGTLWEDNGVYTDGTGQYTGANALAAWIAEFGQTGATFVPVELGGGSGTANGHWNEVDGGGGLTGITDSLGHDMRNELMTGWLNTPSFISDTTLGQFVDIGFTLYGSGGPELPGAPEPSTMTLGFLGVGLFWVVVRFRRR